MGEGSKWPPGSSYKRKGWAGGRTKDGRQLGGQKFSPNHRGTLAGGGVREGLIGTFGHTNHSQQVQQSQITRPGFSGWWGPAEVTCPGRTENLPTSHTRIVSHCPVNVCELGAWLLAVHLISLEPRALLFIKLGPCCRLEALASLGSSSGNLSLAPSLCCPSSPPAFPGAAQLNSDPSFSLAPRDGLQLLRYHTCWRLSSPTDTGSSAASGVPPHRPGVRVVGQKGKSQELMWKVWSHRHVGTGSAPWALMYIRQTTPSPGL